MSSCPREASGRILYLALNAGERSFDSGCASAQDDMTGDVGNGGRGGTPGTAFPTEIMPRYDLNVGDGPRTSRRRRRGTMRAVEDAGPYRRGLEQNNM